MPRISRGFRGHREPAADQSRLPPGQYLTRDFPVLSAGPDAAHRPRQLDVRPRRQRRRASRSWSWDEFLALPTETFTVDIHCVTKWTKLDTSWTGVPVDVLLEGVDAAVRARHRVVRRRLHDQRPARRPDRRQGLGRLPLRRRAARARARRPGATARAAPVLLEEREVGARADAHPAGRAGVLGELRLPQLRRPLEGTALLERLIRRRARTARRCAAAPSRARSRACAEESCWSSVIASASGPSRSCASSAVSELAPPGLTASAIATAGTLSVAPMKRLPCGASCARTNRCAASSTWISAAR